MRDGLWGIVQTPEIINVFSDRNENRLMINALIFRHAYHIFEKRDYEGHAGAVIFVSAAPGRGAKCPPDCPASSGKKCALLFCGFFGIMLLVYRKKYKREEIK